MYLEQTASKRNHALGFVKRNINTRSRSPKERAYKTLVRIVLEYASTVWDLHQTFLTNNIENV